MAGANGRAEAARAAVRAIAEPGGWAAGALWRVAGDGAPLESVGGYWLSGPARAPIEEASLQAAFTRGAGLPGTAWRTGRPAWLESLLDEPGMMRIAATRAAALSSGVALPIVARERVVGVLELLSERTRPRDEAEIEHLLHAAGELGVLLAAEPPR